MHATAPLPVASGVPHRVVAPRDLDSVESSGWFAVDLRGQEYRVCGESCRHGDSVRFYEKADDGHGKDVRIWTVREGSDGVLVAVP